MVLINKRAPDFEIDAYNDGEIVNVRLSDYRGKWVILFFYPADFTFVCPTELEGFAKDYDKFLKKNCEILSASEDTVFSHRAWTKADKRLSGIKYPMLADRKAEIARAYDILNEETGDAMRGLFIINPEGIVKYLVVTDDNVGRSTDETYRILTALQSGGLCPVNWNEGDATIQL